MDIRFADATAGAVTRDAPSAKRYFRCPHFVVSVTTNLSLSELANLNKQTLAHANQPASYLSDYLPITLVSHQSNPYRMPHASHQANSAIDPLSISLSNYH